MTDMNQGPVRPQSPFRLPPPPPANEPFGPPQGSDVSPPPPASEPFGQPQGSYASPPPPAGSPFGQPQGSYASPPPPAGGPFGQPQGSYASPPPPAGSPFGQPQGSYASPPPPQHSAYSAAPTGTLPAEDKSPLISLICGILSWLGLWLLASIPAVIFGVKGRRAAREGRTNNGGMATAGFWLGIANLVIGTVLVIALATAIPVFLSQRQKGVDVGLRRDMKAMAMLQEEYIINHPGTTGLALAPSKPGGTVKVAEGDLTMGPGNVIAVKIRPDGFCLSGYNAGASRAVSATHSMVYLAGSEDVLSAVGVC